MELFTPERIKSETERNNDALEIRSMYLTRMVKSLETKIRVLRGEYEAVKNETKVDFADKILQQKSVLLKELGEIQTKIKKANELYYGMVEKQDVLEEREYKLIQKEENLNKREEYVKMIEKKMYV